MYRPMKMFIFTALLLFCVDLLADDPAYWMPRETLKTELKIRDKPYSDSSAEILYTVPQGSAIEHIRPSSRTGWLKVSTAQGEGYVYKASVVDFVTPLNYIQSLAANEILVHRIEQKVYISVGGWCYIFDAAIADTLPEGKDNAQTIREYLDHKGGMASLSDADKAHCNY